MSDRELLRKVAEVWVDGGGDADGIYWNVNALWSAVMDELERRNGGERTAGGGEHG